MDEVMEGHNIGMAKMSKLNESKNAIQQALDSISRLQTNLQKSSAHYKMKLDSVFNRLTFADHAMEKWMNEFNMDSSLNNTEQRIKYLESEKIKISNVKDAMISSLQKADSVLKKR
jgi:cysteinyl-tRNA synthetase